MDSTKRDNKRGEGGGEGGGEVPCHWEGNWVSVRREVLLRPMVKVIMVDDDDDDDDDVGEGEDDDDEEDDVLVVSEPLSMPLSLS